MTMKIQDLTPDDLPGIQAAAEITVAAFAHFPDTWDTLEEALEELDEALEPGKICLLTRDEHGQIVGWIGGQHSYSMVWELHPRRQRLRPSRHYHVQTTVRPVGS